jgi:hypothetical protein
MLAEEEEELAAPAKPARPPALLLRAATRGDSKLSCTLLRMLTLRSTGGLTETSRAGRLCPGRAAGPGQLRLKTALWKAGCAAAATAAATAEPSSGTVTRKRLLLLPSALLMEAEAAACTGSLTAGATEEASATVSTWLLRGREGSRSLRAEGAGAAAERKAAVAPAASRGACCCCCCRRLPPPAGPA